MCIDFWENEISVTEVLSSVWKQKMECQHLSGYTECEEYDDHRGKPCMEVQYVGHCQGMRGGAPQNGCPQNGRVAHVCITFLSSNLLSDFLWVSFSINEEWWTKPDSNLLILTIVVDLEQIKYFMECACKLSTQGPAAYMKVADTLNSHTLHLLASWEVRDPKETEKRCWKSSCI